MNPSITNGPVFLLFSAIILGFSLLQLAAAFWALGRLRQGQRLEIDMDFVRIADYHAREVREERASYVLQKSSLPPSSTTLPLLCHSDYVLQRSAEVKAIVSTGSLTMEDSVQVEQFADSQGELIISSRCSIGGPVTSKMAVRLGRGTSAGSICAPEITTSDVRPTEQILFSGSEFLEIPASAVKRDPEALPQVSTRQMSGDTWIWEGDLHSLRPLKVACKLIVAGSLIAPAGSTFEDDVKTTGDLLLGPDSICRGALVSDADIELGERTQFQRTIYAAGELRLKAGVRGEGSGELAAYGRLRVALDDNILIRGRIASEGSVDAA